MKRTHIFAVIVTIVTAVSIIALYLKEVESLMDFTLNMENSGYN